MMSIMSKEAQHYLAVALANGISFQMTEAGVDDFCSGFVYYFNNAEVPLHAMGDSDGILVVDYDEEIILSIMICTDGLKFAVHDLDRNVEIAKTILHVINYLRDFFDDQPDSFKAIKHTGLTIVDGSEEIKDFEDEGFTIV